MNAEFTRVFHDMFDPAQAARFQGNFQTVIENSVRKSRAVPMIRQLITQKRT